jgi:hypothetical protein
MPVHNWKQADVGLFHHFHQQWSGELCDGLNAGVLPPGYFALIEQKALGVEPDVLTLSTRPKPDETPAPGGGIALAETPPAVRHVSQVTEAASYAAKANRIGVRNSLGELVAVVEIVSPGNKDRGHSIRAFVEKTLDFLEKGVHVLVIDLFPPGARDPHGIHRAIWDEVRDDDYTPPADKPLTLASYVAAPVYTAYVEAAGVGDPLPPMPIFLDRYTYVRAPLEETYVRTWDKCPRQMRELVENPPAGE